MSRRIPEDTVDQIRQQVDIVDVISEHVQLKKQGKHYLGLCPFHGEKTPSFSVSPDRQLYYCFGCGAGGNVITFIMETQGLDFVEAVQKLAVKTDIELPVFSRHSDGTKKNTKTQHQYQALELTARFYHHLLLNTEQGKEAYHYLQNREFTEELMEHFQLGYAPDKRDMLSSLLKKRNFQEEGVSDIGLLKHNEKEWAYEDRFRHRVMFPIHDLNGKVVGFGGRMLGDAEPKYLNSPESDVFKKNELLYAFHLARPTIRKENKAILFEGYVDVISAYGAGVQNGVASLGTSLTERQAQIIRRNTENVIICYDGDQAGRKAALRSAHLLEQAGCTVQIADLPEGMDPDDYIKHYGAERFRHEVIDAANTVMAFKMKQLRTGKNLNDEGERLQYIEEVIREITNLSGAVERDHYLRLLADEFSLSLEALKQEQYRIYKQKKRDEKDTFRSHQSLYSTKINVDPFQKKELRPAFENAERYLLAHMMRSKEITDGVMEEIGGDFNLDDHIAIAAHLYAHYAQGYAPGDSSFYDRLGDQRLINKATEIAMLQINTEMSQEEWEDYIRQIKNYPKWVEIEQKQKEIKEAEQLQNIEKAKQLLEEWFQLNKSLKHQ